MIASKLICNIGYIVFVFATVRKKNFVHQMKPPVCSISDLIILLFVKKVNPYPPRSGQYSLKMYTCTKLTGDFWNICHPAIHSFFTPLCYNKPYIRFCFTQYTILPKGRSPHAQKIPSEADR